MDDRGYPSTSNGSRLNHARDPWQKWSWLVPVIVVAALAVAYVLLKGPLRDSPGGGGGVTDAELDVEAFEEDASDAPGSVAETGELGTAVEVPVEDAPVTPDEPESVDAVPVESGDSGAEPPDAEGDGADAFVEKPPVESPSK